MPEAGGRELTVAWADAAAAKLACERWHYAGVVPAGKSLRIGAWEDGSFVGAVLFSRGASPYLGTQWGLDSTEVCELTRVALRTHRAPATQIIARALRMLKAQSPGLRLVVSFADPKEGHLGRIYQAGNWIYTGESGRTIEFFVRGRWRHVRGAYYEMAKEGFTYSDDVDPELAKRSRITRGKFRYVYPLDRAMRRLAERRREPYPQTIDDDAATPTEGPEASGLGGRFDPELAASPPG